MHVLHCHIIVALLVTTATPDLEWCAALGAGPQITSIPAQRVVPPSLAAEPKRDSASQNASVAGSNTGMWHIEKYWGNGETVILMTWGDPSKILFVKAGES